MDEMEREMKFLMLLQRLQHGLRKRLLDVREMMEKVKGLSKGWANTNKKLFLKNF